MVGADGGLKNGAWEASLTHQLSARAEVVSSHCAQRRTPTLFQHPWFVSKFFSLQNKMKDKAFCSKI
jgi:hypothetical protein